MKPSLCTWLCLAGLLLAGCEEREARYSTDVALGGDQGLLPGDLQFAYDDRLELGSVTPPDFSDLVPAPREDAAPVDAAEAGSAQAAEGADPDITDLVSRHNELLAAAEYDQAADLYKEEYRELVGMNFGLMPKLMEVVDALGEGSPMAAMMKPMLEKATQMTLVSTEALDENTMLGTVAPGIPAAPPQTWVFERVDGEWQIVGQQGLEPAKIEPLKALYLEMGQKLDELYQELEEGNLNAQQAAVQLQQASMSLATRAAQLLQDEAAGEEAAAEDDLPEDAPTDKLDEDDADPDG